MKKSHLRRLALSKQGLVIQPPFGDGLQGTHNAIEHLGYIQIDTLAVVERAHHHVLWSRVPDYGPNHLNQLIEQKHIFEYWFHAASYLPMRDYRYALPQMASIRNNENRYYNNIDQQLMKNILARVNAEGALRSRDFNKVSKGKGQWWDQGPVRRALERLFMQGDLMICERKGMEKTFNLTERCLPNGINLSTPSLHDYAAYLFDTTLRAHGVFTLKQLLHLKTGKPIREAMHKIIDQRIEAGVITAQKIANAPTLYVDDKALEKVTQSKPTLKVMSPFDNVLIHRERLNTLFDFDYKIECYVPAPKRKFGYFSLPILYDDKFVARINCKAHRAEKRFEVISLHLEKSEHNFDQCFIALGDELQRLANFNHCPHLDTSAIQ